MAKFPTYEEMAKNVAEKALDEFLYHGKSIREWMQIIASEDAISRQAVLDATIKKNSIWNNITNSKGENLEEIISQLPPVNSQEPCSNCCNGNQIEKAKLCQKSYLAGMEHKQEQCADAISRQAVLKMAYDMSEIDGEDFTEPCMVVDVEDIQKLPPVTPQPNRWIPVSERLPKKFSYVNCTCRSLIDDRASWVIETCYVPQPSNSPYSDWGNIPMLNRGECEVIAWMYRDIPKPYKAESEGTNEHNN